MSGRANLYRTAEKELPTEFKILYNLIKTDLDNMEQRVEQRFQAIEQRLYGIEQRLSNIESDIIYLKGYAEDTRNRVANLEP